MAKTKFYAVRVGRIPGIYLDWESTQAQVKEFPGAVFKSFTTRGAAEDWLAGIERSLPEQATLPGLTPLAANDSQDAIPPPAADAAPGSVVIYTDGGSLGNPGPGGYGVVLLSGQARQELSGGYRSTTNSRMELRAAIAGLEALPRRSQVILFSDSRYLVNAIQKGWAQSWRIHNWMCSKDRPAENPDLWERLLALCEYHQVECRWLRGHAGAEHNERCDRLATAAARQPDLPPDTGFEDQQKGVQSSKDRQMTLF
jgi:ribonuclease HI